VQPSLTQVVNRGGAAVPDRGRDLADWSRRRLSCATRRLGGRARPHAGKPVGFSPAPTKDTGSLCGFPRTLDRGGRPRLVFETSSGRTQMTSETIVESTETDCCIVGGGPAGAVLALLLARQGINVTLLEAHTDFDRDFRGDVLQPAALDLIGKMGLAERVLEVALARTRLGPPPRHLKRAPFRISPG
jgi:hypothetical protein